MSGHSSMAPDENIHMELVELEELEVFEIDGALLRELLEEQEGEDDNGGGDQKCVVEPVENGRIKGSNMVDTEQDQEKNHEKQQQEQQDECCNSDDFGWVNNMMEMEPTSLNDVTQNWYPEDTVGMVDFGYVNEDCFSQICEGLVSNEASYGCLWENL